MVNTTQLEKYLKQDRMPTIYCPGCGIGLATKAMLSAFDQLEFNQTNTAVISGIGCTARVPGYLALDSINAIHGRALPIAQGLKATKPDLNVVVISGDGDLLGIGGGHLLHAVRRGMNITTILINNSIYGLTGGQYSPASPTGTVSPTSPEGSPDRPMRVKELVTSYPDTFYARTSCFHIDHMEKVIKQALEWDKFGFVEVISPCPTNFFRRLGFKTPTEIYQHLKKEYKLTRGEQVDLAPNELGIIKT
ncbi:MAG: 2-oxoacid:ferredoxin oxidoreductase subunit beta [Candidatus Pacebacteria bacterium]|nr:2-oxoacid:ferredoxin oxidoreductase subunit beta [Candidatus Paceibacterota bacterium]